MRLQRGSGHASGLRCPCAASRERNAPMPSGGLEFMQAQEAGLAGPGGTGCDDATTTTNSVGGGGTQRFCKGKASCAPSRKLLSETRTRLQRCVPVPSSERGQHFHILRASAASWGVSFGGSPPTLPGQTTIQVKIAIPCCGAGSGAKAPAILHQQQTCTYIVTPAETTRPVFEITGSREQRQRAERRLGTHYLPDRRPADHNNEEGQCLAGMVGNSPAGNSE
ncbi:RNA-binding protein MEX3A [Lates japonicus]|uniref:RNA-binding protein MEX3A n=1 Tax=Lates japonicus TaxID=270547 RepID=A0AAD3R1Z8_LATJO|nr:RNA-binding protein MEX3A [Lates japonicus]